MARHEQRPRQDLYLSALEVQLDGARFVIEMTPVWGNEAPDQAVVRVGAVGFISRLLPVARTLRCICLQESRAM